MTGFNPRPSAGRDVVRKKWFQVAQYVSILAPVRGVTGRDTVNNVQILHVSILAPVRGVTRSLMAFSKSSRKFQSSPQCGA